MESLQDRAYSTIYNSIITLELKPGQRVSDHEFEKQLEMSRTPIREAMLRLSRNGLLNSVPQSGTFVTRINIKKALDARFARQTLERKIVSEITANHTEQNIEDLEFLLLQQKRAISRNELRTFFEADDEFHASLYKFTDHGSIWDWLMSLSIDLNRFRYLRLFDTNLSPTPLIDAHARLIDAIKGDKKGDADKIIEDHLDLQLVDKNDVIKQYPDYFEE
ncbi:GntR family transcriptional regulator [Lentilactobacillus curieae]|uniref:GntR family transcriptional regulator n=1 Tax=Lentilactobacillus curieae TaxID=1138822 RepID=A0A1S6QH08_9LACO|nr:GntR family transcriptional regulator [Lentilactobacillus curieae]AQW20907.1 GntR family transcriptional regulator [Lentilactobacillus curieae]